MPNEYGLVVTRAGRPPRVPPEFYEELKTIVKNLAQTRAIRVCASSMQPVVRSLIVHRCGTDVIRPEKGGFMVGVKFLTKLASDAGLKWRKPYGDARKPPPDADAQIADMILLAACRESASENPSHSQLRPSTWLMQGCGHLRGGARGSVALGG